MQTGQQILKTKDKKNKKFILPFTRDIFENKEEQENIHRSSQYSK